MSDAVDIFLNGIAGVFIGISVLYIAIRLNAFFCSLKKDETS